MKTGFEVFMSVIVIVLAMMIGINYNIQSKESSNARSCQEEVIQMIEDSDFNEFEIEKAKQIAIKAGYTIKIEDAQIYDDKPRYKVTLGYTNSMTFFKKKKTMTIVGYAV